jgi:hypothetical protein
MFKYLHRLPDSQPADPAILVTAVPTWSVGDVITVGVGVGVQLRVVAIDDFPHAELVRARRSRERANSLAWLLLARRGAVSQGSATR